MSVSGIFEAYSKPLSTYDYEALKDDPLIDAATIGLKGSPTNIFKSFTPPQKGAGMMLEGADIGRDLEPRCAARLHTGLCADCTHLDVDAQKWDMGDRNLKMTRPAFGRYLMATIICPRFRPCKIGRAHV